MTCLHLRTHSAYSLSEGAITVKQLISRTKELGMGAVALTDTNNLFGALEFATTAKKEGVQPIIGAQINITSPDKEGDTDILVLLVMSEAGYKNLIKIVSHMYLEGKVNDIPQISLDLIEEKQWDKDLIALSGGMEQGKIHKLIANNRMNEARNHSILMKEIFGDRFYMEIARHSSLSQGQIEEEERLLDLAYDLDIPIVATNEAFFLDKSMHEAHDALLCIAEGTYVGVQERRKVSKNCYLKSKAEMAELFKDLPEALENTINIAKRCHFLLEPIKTIFPKYACSDGRTEAEELRFQSEQGLEKRLEVILENVESMDEKESIRKTYFDQLNYELGVIENMQFPGYFLVVADFIKWSKSQNIPVGPGRGSGAGSVVAWALTITDPDPVKFGLFFERFLNPERVSMPDFDIDFCQSRRDEVIKYVQEKYGADKVAHIITFGKLQARAVLRDVGRVLQMPYGQVDKISKLVPNNPQKPVTLPEAIEMEPLLQEAQRKDETVDHLIKIATQLEGLYRHASTHAAGVVIGDRPLDELVALYHDPRSPLPATQFNMKYVEDAGLIKFDFLGLKTLTVIQKTCDLLKKRGIHVDIGHIPYDDPKTFELLRNVETVGVFQVESGGMGDVLRRLKPDRLEEIVALVALYRPGPMDYIPQYIARRHGEEEVSYMYDELEPILAETFGVIVYQEQVLQIARDLAGYTLGGADSLRRAMGKKIKAEMDMHRKTFIDGVLAKTGGNADKASALFDQIDKFASYAFNKAHAVSYGIIAYQTAYLKAHYPVEFMAATMSLDMHNTDKLVALAREVNRLKIPLLPPDVNKSLADFSVEETQDGTLGVRYALAALKNVGEGAMEALVAERQARGEFKDIFDFVERVDQKILNKRLVENMIGAGTFDTISKNRKLLLNNLEMLLKYPSRSKYQPAGLFGVEETRPRLIECAEFSPFDKLKHEFAAIGFYVSGHPLDSYEDYLKKIGVSSYMEAIEKASYGNQYQKIAGVLATIQEKTSKTGNRYAFLQLSDPTGAFEVTIFSETLSANRDILVPGNSLLLDVNIENKDDVLRVTCSNLKRLDQVVEDAYEIITIDIDPKSVNLQEIINQINNLKTGSSEIRLYIKNGGFCSTISIDGGKRIPSETIAIWKQMKGLSLEML